MQVGYVDPRLAVGDLAYVEYVPSLDGNRVREGETLSSDYRKHKVLCTVDPGYVVEIVRGPTESKGMRWWQVSVHSGCGAERDQVGWMSEGRGRERWMTKLPRAWSKDELCQPPYATRLFRVESAYVQDPDETHDPPWPNRLRAEPDTNAKILGKVEVDATVTLLGGGPVCKDDMVWWPVSAFVDGRTQSGYMSEGDDKGYNLVPRRVRKLLHPHPPAPPDGEGQPTTREEVYAEAKHVLGGVPGWLGSAPDGVLEQFWTTFKWLHVDSALSMRDKTLVAFGAAAALHCKYCIPFHGAELQMSGVTDEAIKEASWVANSVAGFSTYLYGSSYDLDQFLAELQAAGEHMMSQAGKG